MFKNFAPGKNFLEQNCDKIVHPVSGFQFTVDSAFNASEEVALASHYEDVRIFTVGQKTQSATPLAELGTIEQVSLNAPQLIMT